MTDLDPNAIVATCHQCRATIVLVPYGDGIAPAGGHWRTNPDRPSTWHCGNDPAFPVRAHSPMRTEQGDPVLLGPEPGPEYNR